MTTDPQRPPEPPERPWEYATLPPIEARNADPDSDALPTPEGRVRAYCNGTLMYTVGCVPEFLCSTDGEPGQPQGLTFEAPVAVFPDDEAGTARLETHLGQSIPIVECEPDSKGVWRRWVTDEAVSWAIELTLERTLYTTEGER